VFQPHSCAFALRLKKSFHLSSPVTMLRRRASPSSDTVSKGGLQGCPNGYVSSAPWVVFNYLAQTLWKSNKSVKDDFAGRTVTN
jgi:hypothetical protein